MTEGSSPIPIYHMAEYEANVQPFGHPESPDRVTAIMILLRKSGLAHEVRTPIPAKEQDILPVHSKQHHDLVRDFVALRRLALAGASRSGRKFGNVLLRELKVRGEICYRVRLAPKRGREVPLDVWRALDDRITE